MINQLIVKYKKFMNIKTFFKYIKCSFRSIHRKRGSLNHCFLHNHVSNLAHIIAPYSTPHLYSWNKKLNTIMCTIKIKSLCQKVLPLLLMACIYDIFMKVHSIITCPKQQQKKIFRIFIKNNIHAECSSHNNIPSRQKQNCNLL